jgi:UTP--glucose-1-phosphate uridylyltransferase
MRERLVRKIILPVAGLGIRLGVLTRRTPKALVSVAGRPMLDYALLEARESGLREAILVVAPWCRSHFAAYLKKKKRHRGLRIEIAVQPVPLGTGDAVCAAASYLRGEPFAVRYCDDVLYGRLPILSGLIKVFARHRKPLFTLKRVPKQEVRRYGVVAIGPSSRPPLYEVTGLVERPWDAVEVPPSRLAVVGAYVLTSRLLGHLVAAKLVAPILKDSLPINIAFREEFHRGGKVYGWEFGGVRFDCGVPEGIKEAEEFLKK